MVKIGSTTFTYSKKIVKNMKALLEYIIKPLVNHPDDVVITEEKLEDESWSYKVQANSEDMGRLIGKEGKIIKAIRNLVKVYAVKNNLLINFEF